MRIFYDCEFIEAGPDHPVELVSIGMVADDGRIHVVVGTGAAKRLQGITVPISTSAMGRVIRTGTSWSVRDVSENAPEVEETLARHLGDDARHDVGRRPGRI